jgi:hypothetical protein
VIIVLPQFVNKSSLEDNEESSLVKINLKAPANKIPSAREAGKGYSKVYQPL